MGERIVSQRTMFTNRNSEEVSAYMSRPLEHDRTPGLVVGHEWWGVDPHFRELSRELAAEGFVVLVPDLYDGVVTDDWDEAAALKGNLDVLRAAESFADGREYLAGLPYVGETVGALGYCMGGGVALLGLAVSDSFDCGVLYFPSIYPDESDLERIGCPVLLHYGTEDEATPPSEIERIERVLDANDVPCTRYDYEGAGHAFTNDTYEALYDAEASAEAWPRTIEFLDAHLNEP